MVTDSGRIVASFRQRRQFSLSIGCESEARTDIFTGACFRLVGSGRMSYDSASSLQLQSRSERTHEAFKGLEEETPSGDDDQ